MKKKILFFTNGLYGGGAEQILLTLLTHIDYTLFNITLYSLTKDDVTKEYPEQIHYNYIFHPISDQDNCWRRITKKIINKFKHLIYHHFSAKLFYALFVKGNYDTEVAFIEGYATRIVSGSNNKRSKKIAWVHTDLKNNHWTTIAYRSCQEEQESYQQFDEVTSVSLDVKTSFDLLFSHPNSTVTYNPIDENKIKLLADKSINPICWLEQGLIMVTMGRLVPQKGYDRLLPIIKRLKDEGFRFSLNILGEGTDREKLEQYIKQHHLETCVRLSGFHTNPYPYLAKADLFVCSSRAEGYSTVITEALILGLPIITTRCAGMQELLGENGEFGLIVDNNGTSLYEGLKTLLPSNTCLMHYKQKSQEKGRQFALKNLEQKVYEKL